MERRVVGVLELHDDGAVAVFEVGFVEEGVVEVPVLGVDVLELAGVEDFVDLLEGVGVLDPDVEEVVDGGVGVEVVGEDDGLVEDDHGLRRRREVLYLCAYVEYVVLYYLLLLHLPLVYLALLPTLPLFSLVLALVAPETFSRLQ